MSGLPAIDRHWTLFLDRDGVLNRRIMGGYVESPAMLDILPGVPEALAALSSLFGRIVVVTNQRGIALGRMTEEDLAAVHGRLLEEIQAAGGRIDAFYHCPHDRDAGCECRKPGTGMALQAQRDFPEIDFTRSVLLGDSPSDMALGRALGMYCVWVKGADAVSDFDLSAESLADCANLLAGMG